MDRTYSAILRGRTLYWKQEAPNLSSLEREISVQVTILDEATPEQSANTQGILMAEALERLAHLPVRSLQQEPSLWEREIRQERSLPARDS